MEFVDLGLSTLERSQPTLRGLLGTHIFCWDSQLERSKGISLAGFHSNVDTFHIADCLFGCCQTPTQPGVVTWPTPKP